MSDLTISPGGSLTLDMPLTGGTNIDFLDDGGAPSTLSLTPGVIHAVTTGTGFGVSLVSASMGGTVENFQPGDKIVLDNIDQVFAGLNVNPWNVLDDVVFDVGIVAGALQHGAILVGPDGAVTDNFCLPLDNNTKTILEDVRSALFGPGVGNAVLTITPEFTGFLQPIEGVITSDETINPCFAAGTRILTTRGEIAVENLKAGDLAITVSGEAQEIIWIGKRDIDIARHPLPGAVRPIIIEAGALEDGVPSRRLVVSPDHALHIDDMLVQAKDIVNAGSIRPHDEARHVRYFHVELRRHDIIFAEGAAAESYLDTGHRGVFDNAAAPLLLHPDLMQIRREAEGCAPLLLGGKKLFRIRQRLLHRDAMRRRRDTGTPATSQG